MIARQLILGALLLAAPRFSTAFGEPDPRTRPEFLLEFTLSETEGEVAAKMGPPRQVADLSTDYRAYHFQIGVDDLHELSHILVFSRTSGKLVSITQNFEPERDVTALFPPGDSRVHFWPDAEKPQYSILVRKLPGNRLLMSMGTRKPSDPAGQLMLIRRDALAAFHPWLAAQLSSE
ncbi:MAG: hypothetical protein K2X35_11465 [Bryobacteraceae bacterium]|nr:hypothetical protein [Bryobacteraceae bacterium]